MCCCLRVVAIHAVYLPGQEDDLQLEKYKTVLGKDYKRITMSLCTTADFEMSEDNNPTNSELSFSTPIKMPESSSANDFESASVITPSRSFLDKNGTPPTGGPRKWRVWLFV